MTAAEPVIIIIAIYVLVILNFKECLSRRTMYRLDFKTEHGVRFEYINLNLISSHAERLTLPNNKLKARNFLPLASSKGHFDERPFKILSLSVNC